MLKKERCGIGLLRWTPYEAKVGTVARQLVFLVFQSFGVSSGGGSANAECRRAVSVLALSAACGAVSEVCSSVKSET
jgi:hypothetical protein